MATIPTRFGPGSYTKNFGWNQYGPGLVGLYQAIRNGFGTSTTPVTRDAFRRNCGIDDSARQLIPLNFFLHNQVLGGANHVSVDELVRHALLHPHSRQFDRLALFAFHLARMGQRLGGNAGTSDGAAFANRYVREVLWQGGGWRTAMLAPEQVEEAFDRTILAQGIDTVHKCVTNYLFTLQVCGLRNQRTPVVNTHAEEWIGPALFLAFDRANFDAARNLAHDELLRLVEAEELYKLIGVPSEDVRRVAAYCVDQYVQLGGTRRRSEVVVNPTGVAGVYALPPISTGTVEPSAPAWTDESAEDAAQVMRSLRQVEAQIRNPRNVRELKELYSHACAFCTKQMVIGVMPTRYYSEAAHIKPVGMPHGGPDRKGNMLVLCPEHHLQFDRGVVGIGWGSTGYFVVSKVPGDPIHGRSIELCPPHALEHEHVEWHFFYWGFDREDAELETNPF